MFSKWIARPGREHAMNHPILMTSGIGQSHTNEVDPKKPNRKLTPYSTIDLEGIRALVDNPQQCEKAQAQWLIPSTLPSRNFGRQEREGVVRRNPRNFWILFSEYTTLIYKVSQVLYLRFILKTQLF